MIVDLLPKSNLPTSWIRNCTIEARDDESFLSCGTDGDPADNFMFYGTDVGILVRLDGYAIIPIEKYNELKNP